MENILPPKSGGSIHALGEHLSRRICTGQVIVSLAGACRELVDNAIDAGATNIEIRVTDNGVGCLEVIDNGSGITPSNFEHLCKAHSTSKLSELDDFRSLTTFGFRGEALNALAALGDVQITTRDANSRCATRLTFGRNGEQLATEQCSRQQGTTVHVSHLFKPLPVRRAEFQRQARREFLRLVECLQAFAIALPQCRFTCTNSVNGGKRLTVLCTPGGPSTSLPQVLDTLFGTVGVGDGTSDAKNKANGGGLLLLNETVGVPDGECLQLYGVQQPTSASATEQREKIFAEIRLSGYVSSCLTGQGRSSADRQFVFVNQRHVDFPKLCRIANEVYAQFNRGRFCCLVLFVDVPPHTLDVNISPDKRTVFLHYEKELFAKFRATLFATFAKCQGHCSIATPSVQAVNLGSPEAKKRRTFGTLLRWGDSLEAENDGKTVERRDQMEMAENDDGQTDEQPNFNRNIIFPVETQQSVDLSCMTFSNVETLDEIEQSLNNVYESFDQNIQRKTQNENFYDDNWPNGNCVGTKMSRKSQTRKSTVKLTAGQKALEAFSFQRLRSAGSSKMSAFTSDNEQHHDIEQQQRTTFTLTDQQQQMSNAHNFRLADQIMPKNEPPNSQKSPYYGSQDHCLPPTSAEAAITEFEYAAAASSSSSAGADERCCHTLASSSQPISQFSSVTAATNLSQTQHSDDQQHYLFSDDIFDDDEPMMSSLSSLSSPSSSFRPQQIVQIDMNVLRTNFMNRCAQLRKQRREQMLGQSYESNDDEGTQLRVTTADTVLTDSQGMEDTVAVEQRLSMMLNKADFARMRLIGQFNNAFIIARLRSDVFIIDQHAADEKYNFERLLAQTVIKSQKLIRPQCLRLGNVNTALMRDNLHVFHANGFGFQFNNREKNENLCSEDNETADGNADDAIAFEITDDSVEPFTLNSEYACNEEEVAEASSDKHGTVLLTAVPLLHGWQLNRDDIDQLLSMLTELPGVIHRPSKVRKIFASKACRHSVMFGKALTPREMETIILNMGSMDQPWNCPHGRPTIRHLCTVERI